MILYYPTKHDFFGAANDYLNSSWGSVIDLLIEFEDLGSLIEDLDHEEESERYWRSAKQTLVSATALVQQAIEFYIKGKLADVSPYLLISGNPQSWPKGCSKEDIEFSSFRTLDAQDLLKVHDTVCEKRFSDEFIQLYGELRIFRNKVMHTVDKSLEVSPEDVLRFILFAQNYFSESVAWFKSRRQHLEKTPANSMKTIKDDDDSEAYIVQSLLIEFRMVCEVLKPAQVKQYLGFNKKAKCHHCPKCVQVMSQMYFWDNDFLDNYGKTYQELDRLGNFECNLCHYKGNMLKKPCKEVGCESMLLDSGKGICFLCFSENAL